MHAVALVAARCSNFNGHSARAAGDRFRRRARATKPFPLQLQSRQTSARRPRVYYRRLRLPRHKRRRCLSLSRPAHNQSPCHFKKSKQCLCRKSSRHPSRLPLDIAGRRSGIQRRIFTKHLPPRLDRDRLNQRKLTRSAMLRAPPNR